MYYKSESKMHKQNLNTEDLNYVINKTVVLEYTIKGHGYGEI